MRVEIIDNHEEFKKAKDEAVKRALEKIGMAAEGYAKMGCPVDTGLLRNSLTYAVAGQSPNISSYKDNAGNQKGNYPVTMPRENGEDAVYIGSNVEYAQIVETNEKATHLTGGPHFLRNAVTTHNDQYKDIILNELKGAGL